MGGEILTNIESLPDDLLFAILVHVPAQDIQNGARFVCRKWHRIINSPNFIYAHLQNSPPGLVIQYWGATRHLIFVAMQQGRIKISELNNKFISFSLGSCNGLVLDTLWRDIYVTDHTREQRYALPPISPHKGVYYCRAAMAYAAASMEYKVVVPYSYPYDDLTSAVLTVGVDRDWRHINNEHHKSPRARDFFLHSPVIAIGSIHWTKPQGTRLLTLNVETEVFTSTPVPRGYEERFKYYLTTGTSLTMLVDCSHLSWEVWELKEEESGEWIKLFMIDVEAQKGRIQELVPNCSLIPVGWLDYGQVLVLHAYHTPKVCFLYNVRTQEIDSFEFNHYLYDPKFMFHKNSLVHLVV